MIPTDATLNCVACGYSLAGLDEVSTCPECGTPVEHSLHHRRLLRFDDYQWRTTVVHSACWLFRGVFALLWMPIALAVVVAVVHATQRLFLRQSSIDPSRLIELMTLILLMTLLLALACALVCAISCMQLSRGNTGLIKPSSLSRHAVRLGVILAAAGLGVYFFPGLPPAWDVNLIARLAVSFGYWSAYFGVLAIFQHLERRTTSWEASLERSYRRHRILNIVLMLACTLGPIGTIINVLIGGLAAAWSLAGALVTIYFSILPTGVALSRICDALRFEHAAARGLRREHPKPSEPPGDG